MATDNFKTVNWTAGQEVRAQDLNDSQKFLAAMITDQIFSKLTAGDLETQTPHDASLITDGGGQTLWCHALTVAGGQPRLGSANNKVRISAGTVFVRASGGENGNDRTFLPWTFDGTDELTIANGHATQYRWDLIQLKLELVNTDPQARVFANPPVSASLDLSTVAANVTIEVRATLPGTDGNSLRVRFQPGGPGVVITESGRDVTIEYEDGVSTVQDVVDAITNDATLIVVSDYSGAATVLNDPGETFDYQSLSGGLDTVLVSSNVNMKRRVQATLNVKQGPTFSSGAAYPTSPDSGFVALAAVLVPPTWTGATPISYFMEEQFAGSEVLAVMHDLRMPMRVKEYTVEAHQMIRDSDVWEDNDSFSVTQEVKSNQSGPGGHHLLIARCPVKIGRLVGLTFVAAGGDAGGTATTGGLGGTVGVNPEGGAIVVPYFKPGGPVDLAGADVSILWSGTTSGSPEKLYADQELIGKNPFNVGLSNTFINQMGYPIWCNGGRVCVEDGTEPTKYEFRYLEGVGSAIGVGPYEHGLCVIFLNSNDAVVQSVTFHVAEGL